MIKLSKETKKELIELLNSKNIGLEGNIIKLIDGDDPDFSGYLKTCAEKDKESRRKRLEITRQVQNQNKELTELNSENKKIMSELQETLTSVEESKQKIEVQNKELKTLNDDNERINQELRVEMEKTQLAKLEAEKAKQNAENDLDVLQKKTQFELINIIVKMALFIIIGVGFTTTLMYVIAILTNKDTQIIGSTWSNMFGILLTNAFSVVGTIMGVKYASESTNSKQ